MIRIVARFLIIIIFYIIEVKTYFGRKILAFIIIILFTGIIYLSYIVFGNWNKTFLLILLSIMLIVVFFFFNRTFANDFKLLKQSMVIKSFEF